MGAEGQRILYDRSGASSSRSRRGEDPRIAQLQREMEEQQRALDEQQRCLEEQRKKEEETRARLEAMERISISTLLPGCLHLVLFRRSLSAGIRNQPQPQPYVLHPEQTPQVPHMGGYLRSNSATGLPSFGSIQDINFHNLFQTSGGSQTGGSRGGGSRGGGSRGGNREGQAGDNREDETEEDYLYDDSRYYHNGSRRSL
ncbi:unnamed protein product [Cuscuta epithymum]|uniref:Uncharacterized protein n=1 Tax=Cuscuta epithymum TaxID=186058 RepID=A0AAV0D9X2_9ASTE|nr:unnamed protein product [Cuscuta epithymum]